MSHTKVLFQSHLGLKYGTALPIKMGKLYFCSVSVFLVFCPLDYLKGLLKRDFGKHVGVRPETQKGCN